MMDVLWVHFLPGHSVTTVKADVMGLFAVICRPVN